jgi:hypothetical protein
MTGSVTYLPPMSDHPTTLPESVHTHRVVSNMKSTNTLLCSLVQVLSLAPVYSLGDFRRPVDSSFGSLGSMLSEGAEIYFPGSDGFVNGTATLAAKKPQLDALVKVVTEGDVQNTVFGSFLHN